MKNKEYSKDMTCGKPFFLILEFLIPMMLGMFFQQFYSMADTVIVGRFLGVEALAAVGSTGSLNFLLNGFVMGVCAGFSIPVAQFFGAKDYAHMRKCVANILWLSILFAAVMTIAVCMLLYRILVWMNTPDNIMEGAYAYFFIIVAGIPVTYLYNMTSGIIRALGDSKTPVYFLLIASVLNIFGDIFTIQVLQMGVAGPAVATVLSQGFSGLLCLWFIIKKYPLLQFKKGEMQFQGDICMQLCGMGIPMGLQYSVTAIGSAVLQAAVNLLGSTAVAAVTAGGKLNMFFACVFDALGATIGTYTGQNIGAGKMERITKGVYAATAIGAVYSVLACLILFLIGKPALTLFVSAAETDVISSADLFILHNSIFYIGLAVVNIWRFAIQGMGYSNLAILSGICEMIARAGVGFLGVPVFGFAAVTYANPMAWFLADFFLIPVYYSCYKRKKRAFAHASE